MMKLHNGELNTTAEKLLKWPAMSVDQRQREYSPSTPLNGNYMPFVRRYLTESDRAREACRNLETRFYGSRYTNSIDFALVTAGSHVPLIVYLHGGYWQAHSKQDSFFGADWFVDHGIAYGAVDYTLAPHATLSEIVHECYSAIAHILKIAPDLGIDPDRVFLAGSSAGAHLAAMCCCHEGYGARIAGSVLLSGIYELEPFVDITDNEVVKMSVAEARINSPLLRNTRHFPRSIITWGEQETGEFKAQSQSLSAKLRRDDREVESFESAARNHFDLVHDLYDPASELGRRVLNLISK